MLWASALILVIFLKRMLISREIGSMKQKRKLANFLIGVREIRTRIFVERIHKEIR